MERWKIIENTDGKLEISDKGRVRSNLREGRILKANIDKKGYLRVSVTINRQKRTLKVHRLVAEAFVPNTNNKPQVNHIDGNKSNNEWTNLEWVTNQENVIHAYSNGLAHGCKQENKMKPVIATNISTGETMSFKSVSDAERYFNTRHIVDVIKGKREKAKGHTFAYQRG